MSKVVVSSELLERVHDLCEYWFTRESRAGMSEVQRLREALRDTARWIERLPVPTQGAIRQLERIDAALAASTGQEVKP